MEKSSTRQNAMVMATLLGIVPCILGASIGQYLRWSGTIWLTDAGAFWPIVCLGTSLAALLKLAQTPDGAKTTRAGAWLIFTWTWLYFPLWLTALDIPQSSAVVSKDGRATIASKSARHDTNKVWLLSGRAGNNIVRNVEGTVPVNGVEVGYHFAESYIATRSDGEDISKPVIDAVNSALAVEGKKSRASRIALFEKSEVYKRVLDNICRAVVRGDGACPLRLTLTPQSAAMIPGAVWSKQYTEQEAIDEKHLPTLVQLLTQDNSRLVDRDLAFALFTELADNVGVLSKVARKSRVLTEYQFGELIKRILVAPDAGNEALGILVEVNRLTQEQRQALRDKALHEANVALIVKHFVPLHISDAEIAQLDARMRSAFEKYPDVAVSALEIFGERLPRGTQYDAVRAIANVKVSYALAALRHLNFSSTLRQALLQKVIADADFDDLNAAINSRDKLEDLLTPTELRPFIENVIKKSESSKDWLGLAVRVLPVRAMTLDERKALVNELMFANTKSALEFVSENRQHLEFADVSDVTHDYTKTITRDMCLHLTHRNASRQLDYFSETQVQIFRDCAQAK